MNPPPPVAETFRDKACRHFGVPPERYAETVLRLTLYPHARWLPLLAPAGVLAADREFVAAVGRITSWRGFVGIEQDFQYDARNRLFWRRTLRLRVSVGRMCALFSEVWGKSPPPTTERSASADRARHTSPLTG